MKCFVAVEEQKKAKCWLICPMLKQGPLPSVEDYLEQEVKDRNVPMMEKQLDQKAERERSEFRVNRREKTLHMPLRQSYRWVDGG